MAVSRHFVYTLCNRRSRSSFIFTFKFLSVTQHARAGLIFSVVRVRRNLKIGRYARLIRPGSSVYLASVLEYLVAEVMELAGNAARDNKRHSITPRHITLAIRQDEELQKLMQHVTFSQGGVIPFIHSVLLPKRTTKRSEKSSEEM